MLLFAPLSITQAQDAPAFWDDIFTYHDPETVLAPRAPGDVVMMGTGDVLLARSINARMMKSHDFTFPFAKLGPFLAQADIAWVNLETPLLTGCPIQYVGMKFCGDPQTAASLVFAGIDAANIANNHSENQGEAGVLETEQILTDLGIGITGRAKPVIFERQGKRIGLLGFTDIDTVNWVSAARDEDVAAQIKSLRATVDEVIVCFHWGLEYHLEQTDRQRDLAKLAIDSGADIVIGHHPHWVQGVELYHGKPIVYSLGNFVFDQAFGGWVNEGAIALITFKANGALTVNLIPVVIDDQSTPRFANKWRAGKILKRILSVSAILGD